MQSSLKKSLYLGLAALSFVAAAGVATTSASAASKATVKTNTTMTTAASTRNVNLTGTNAVYTKPGTVKGAKLVASTTTAKRLGDSKKSLDNFRAYRVAVTNRGSVYYKVVSFDKAYRGWIYGGKTSGTFAAGVKSFDTFTAGTVTSAQTSNFYSFKTPAAEAGGKANYANAGTSVTYTQPAWTQYKVGRAVTSTADDANVKDLVISKTGTRGKEGDTWVYVTSASTPAVNGWILSSSLSNTGKANVAAADGVTVNYVNYYTGASLGSEVIAYNGTESTTYVGARQLTVPAGYTVRNFAKGTTKWSPTVAKGGSVVVYVTQARQVKTANKTATDVAGSSNPVLPAGTSAKLNTAVTNAKIFEGTTVTVAQKEQILKDAGVYTFTFTKNGKNYTATYNGGLTATTDVTAAKASASSFLTANYAVTEN